MGGDQDQAKNCTFQGAPRTELVQGAGLTGVPSKIAWTGLDSSPQKRHRGVGLWRGYQPAAYISLKRPPMVAGGVGSVSPLLPIISTRMKQLLEELECFLRYFVAG